MGAKKASKAKQAAKKATSKKMSQEGDAVEAGLLTRKRVELLIKAFNDTKLVPEHDEEAVAALVDSFYRFVDVVARGEVEVEAMPLAAEMVRLGYSWLDKNPRHIRINSEVWSKDLVENTITWFGGAMADAKNVKDTVARFAAFERVWRSGWVEPGDATVIAQAFVEHGKDWLRKNPEAQKAYDALN